MTEYNQKQTQSLDLFKYVIDNVITIVCNEFSVTAGQIKTNCRKREFVEPRQICMYFLSKHTLLTLKNIGIVFGRHHSTVIDAKKVVENMYDVDFRIKSIINKLNPDIKKACLQKS